MQTENYLSADENFEVIGELNNSNYQYLKVKNLNPAGNNLPGEILFRVFDFLDTKFHFQQYSSHVQYEYESIKKINHPGVVKQYGVSRYNGLVVELLDNVEGTSLREYINEIDSYSEDKAIVAKKLILEIIDAIGEINRHVISRGNIGPEEIIIDSNGHAKILYLSLCAIVQAQPSKKPYPTSFFINLRREYDHNKKCGYLSDETIDVRTCAMIFHEMLTGKKHPNEVKDICNTDYSKYKKVIQAALSDKILNLGQLRDAIVNEKVSVIPAFSTLLKLKYAKLKEHIRINKL